MALVRPLLTNTRFSQQRRRCPKLCLMRPFCGALHGSVGGAGARAPGSIEEHVPLASVEQRNAALQLSGSTLASSPDAVQKKPWQQQEKRPRLHPFRGVLVSDLSIHPLNVSQRL